MTNLLKQTKDSLKVGLDNTEQFFADVKIEELRNDFIGRIVTLIIASLALITALAWEDVLKEVFYILFGSLNNVFVETIYALCLTALTVLASVIIGKRYLNQVKDTEAEKQKRILSE